MNETERTFWGIHVIGFVLRHYEDFDPRFKAILPLKKVYIPAPIQAEE